MTRDFDKFLIKIINKAFKTDKAKSDKMVEITFVKNNIEIDKIHLAYINIEELYLKIDKAEEICLDNCYIHNFSIANYRQSRNKNNNELINILNFSADNAIFDNSNGGGALDFSYLNFEGTTHFQNCIFTGTDTVLFNNTNFIDAVFFDNSLFDKLDLIFSHANIGNGTFSFKNVIFRKGNKKFENIHFGSGDVLFLNTEFNEGDVSFSGSEFGNGKVSFKIARFGKGRKDFSKIHFGTGDIIFEKVEFTDGDVNFRSTHFGTGKVEFTRCEFGAGDISFISADFGQGDVSFAGTEFGNGKLSFKLANFGEGKLDFHYAHFGIGDVIFERTNFSGGNVDFRAVDFGTGKITFNRALFGDGEVIFEASELKKGRITFRRTLFGLGVFNFEMADFSNAELIIDDVNFGQGKVSFKQSKFGLLSLESSQMNNYFDLRVEECGKLDLSNTIVKDIIDIDSADYKTNIKALDLSGIRLLGRIYIDWEQNNVKELIHQQNTNYLNKAEQFRVLKENYNLIGQYDYEDKAYVEFKRLESDYIHEMGKTRKTIPRLWSHITYFARWLIFDKVGKYATDPIRVLMSMTVVFFAFSLIYIFIPEISASSQIISALFQEGDPRDLGLIQKAFYHSAITFLTIGYGDYYPSGHIRWLSGIEGFIGLFLMSYFTVAFVRKILR
ncbi:MAG: potassium channel family protein [Bacteroidales bacterium]|nr:potassium channel family protein [Bacteroidales bacterium]